MQIFVVTYRISLMFFENCLLLIVYRGGNYGKFFRICHLKVIFAEYYRVLVLFYESLTYCWLYSLHDCNLYMVYLFVLFVKHFLEVLVMKRTFYFSELNVTTTIR